MRSPAPAVPVLETRSREAVPAMIPIPEIRLKAMVFSDADHASAILSANGRSVSLSLSRTQLRNYSGQTASPPVVFTVGVMYFEVEDFSDHSIRLRQPSDNTVIVVQ